GKVVGRGQVRPVGAKVEAICNFPAPSNRRGLRRFLGMVGYYRGFCENFASVVTPLTNLLSVKVPFHWTDASQQAFEAAKALLSSAPCVADINRDQMLHSTIEKEALALVWAVQYFDVYLSPASVPITVYTDDNPR